MAQSTLSTLILQIKLLLWKNYKLKTRRWKEVLLMIGFAVFSMLLIGAFRSDVETQTIPAYHPSPQPFFNFLQSHDRVIDGTMAILNNLPNNAQNTQKIELLKLSLGQWFKTYHNSITILTNITSDSQLDHIITSQDNATSHSSATNINPIRLAIDINKFDQNSFDYTIRLPSQWVPSSSDQLIASDQQTSAQALAQTFGIGHSYSQQFIPLQVWLDQFYIRYTQQTLQSNPSVLSLLNIGLQFQEFWTKQHSQDPFMESMGSLLPFYIVSCFLLPFSYMIKDIVEEKSAKIKEGMRTMGLHILSFWISWFLTYLCLISIVATIVMFIQWKTSMLLHTSFAVLYVLYLLYGFSIITFASAMTTFFDKPKTASTVSGFTYFLLQMPAYAIKSELDTTAFATKMLFSLSSPTGMFLCLLSIVKLEQNGKGYTFDNLFDTEIVPAVQNGYALGYSMIMLVIDIIIYTILTWFLDQYLRSEYGQKLSIKQILSQICCCTVSLRNNLFSNSISYKPLSKHQRHSLMSDESDNILLSPNDIEMNSINISAEATHKNVSIQMINLSKTYEGNGVSSKSVHAVDNLSMNIYESEVCALLGHNGAGKSTCINLLTGMVDVTSGSANINGLNINHEMNEIRQFLGVCPQHSLLYPMLTVYEHLYLFAILKNMKKASINPEIDTLLQEVGLSEKKKSYASTLSGGQKRKLSLAIAFIGDPKVIFLDEPTSGMDPVSRRYTWDLIEKYKQNRCIVLTTHDMNEADAIADRIGIMSHGKLRIYGSSLYLKSVCGVGYNLIFTINFKHFNSDNMKPHLDKITNVIQTFIENAVLFDSENVYNDVDKYRNNTDALSMEVTYKTSIQDSEKFPALFQYIDSHLNSLRIEHYAVSVTTLEEVFLKIAGDNNLYSMPKIQPFQLCNPSQTTETLSTSLTQSISQSPNDSNPNPNPNQTQPCKMEEFNIDSEVIQALCQFQRPDLHSHQRFRIHIGTLMKKRFRVSRRDLRGIITQCIMPLLSLLFGLSLIQTFDSVHNSQPTLDMSTHTYQTPLIFPYNNFFNSSSTDVINALPQTNIKAINISDIHSYNQFNEWIVNETYNKEHSYNIDTVYAALYVQSNKDVLTFLYDAKATHVLPALINQWNQAILNRVRGDNNGKLSVASHPFPLSSNEIGMVDFGMTLMTVILISLSYAFIPTSFAAFIVQERESKVKHQQIIAGMGIVSYWISNLLFDLIIFMIPCITGGIVIVLFDIKLFTQNVNSFAIILIFLLFGLSVITLTYLLSFLFKNPQSAQTILGRMYEISGLLFLIIGIMIAQFIPSNTYLWADALLFVFRLFPNYAFGEGLFNLTYSQQQSSILGQFGFETHSNINVFKWNVLGKDLCFMLSTTVSNLILIALIEYVSFNAHLMTYFNQKCFNSSFHNYNFISSDDSEEFEDEDSDILCEKESIINGEKRYNSSIELIGLKKIFKSKKNNNIPKIAVNDLYFAVGESEIFGFLGSNGAGKTTTMKMLTKELVPTNGTAQFKNYTYSNNILDSNYFKFFYESFLGYCPQSDGLVELLTGKEHLQLYCRIRGFNTKNTNTFVDLIIDCLKLKEFANGTVNKYSGGNRRKLCVGIALIGNPSICMLDEPSTGIDPLSRRFMWNFISEMTRNNNKNLVNSKRSVLLTTHSMEEAENLCDRIGIMSQGKLKCLGTSQHLKTKYGNGYELYIKLKENFTMEIKDALKGYVLNGNIIGNKISVKLIDDHNVILRFSIQLIDASNSNSEFSDDFDEKEERKNMEIPIPLGKVFEAIESVKKEYEIVEYSISQNTLEQVFLHLVDEEEDDDGNGNSHQSKCRRLCCS